MGDSGGECRVAHVETRSGRWVGCTVEGQNDGVGRRSGTCSVDAAMAELGIPPMWSCIGSSAQTEATPPQLVMQSPQSPRGGARTEYYALRPSTPTEAPRTEKMPKLAARPASAVKSGSSTSGRKTRFSRSLPYSPPGTHRMPANTFNARVARQTAETMAIVHRQRFQHARQALKIAPLMFLARVAWLTIAV